MNNIVAGDFNPRKKENDYQEMSAVSTKHANIQGLARALINQMPRAHGSQEDG
jgi:hypothetical protein